MVTTTSTAGAPVPTIVRTEPESWSLAASVRVTMLVSISGTRDGVDWPPVGGEFLLSADEAAGLVSNGLAAVIPDTAGAEQPEEEQATLPDQTPERAVLSRAPRGARPKGRSKGRTR